MFTPESAASINGEPINFSEVEKNYNSKAANKSKFRISNLAGITSFVSTKTGRIYCFAAV